MGSVAEMTVPYQAAMRGDWELLKSFFQKNRGSVVLPLTVNKDTVLHIAIYSGRMDLIVEIITIAKEIAEHPSTKQNPFMISNEYGNTPIHEAAATGNVKAVELLLDCEKDLLEVKNKLGETQLYGEPLLEVRNKLGETPLFRAAAFGRTEMVEFLAAEVKKNTPLIPTQRHRGPFTTIHGRRNDLTSILHIAIHGEHFETAVWLQKNDEALGELKDKNGWTGLHLLANMPSAFRSGKTMGRLDGLLYSCLPDDNDQDGHQEVEQPSHGKGDLESGEGEAHLRRPTWTNVRRAISNMYSALWSSVAQGLPDHKNQDGDQKAQQQPSDQKKDLDSGEGGSHFRRFGGSNVRTAISRIYHTVWSCIAQGWPAVDKIWKEKKRHESVLKLARLLVRKDTSWEISHGEPDTGTISFGEKGRVKWSPKLEKWKTSFFAVDNEGGGDGRKGGGTTSSQSMDKTTIPPTPLLMATKAGIMEIVDEILKLYPQAVEHVSDIGQNILHVTIKHRQREIFRRVKKMKIPMAILVRKIDINGYTLLHHAAEIQDYRAGPQPSPALQLQEELRWLKRVQKIIPPHYAMHHNNGGMTAQEAFEKNHYQLQKDAQEWLKRTSESCSVIAVLIATVAFTAAYTVPGGTDDKTGFPILLKYPFFLVFTVMDILSLASSLTCVVMFLSILTSPFQLQDFTLSLPRKLTLGFTFLFLSVAATMLAFAATIVLEIHLKARLTTTLIYAVAFLPVTVFALLQFPLYVAFTGTLKGSLNVIKKILPWNFVRRIFRNTMHSIRKTN